MLDLRSYLSISIIPKYRTELAQADLVSPRARYLLGFGTAGGSDANDSWPRMAATPAKPACSTGGISVTLHRQITATSAAEFTEDQMPSGLASSSFSLIAIAFGLVGALLIIAGILSLLGLHPIRFAMRTLIGILFLACGALLGTLASGVQGFRSLTHEEVAARLSVRPTSAQHFTSTVRFPDGRQETFAIAGDEIYVDAHILKWKPIAGFLGLHTAYELDRIEGRYRNIEQERSGVRTVYSLGSEKQVDLFDLRQRHAFLEPLFDAQYGSATFVPVTGPADLEVRVSTTGLLMREIRHKPPL
jgi:hypothetical protein